MYILRLHSQQWDPNFCTPFNLYQLELEQREVMCDKPNSVLRKVASDCSSESTLPRPTEYILRQFPEVSRQLPVPPHQGWQEALEVSHNIDHVSLICNIIQDPTTSLRILSARQICDLDGFLDKIYGSRHDPPYLHQSSIYKAGKILEIFENDRRLPIEAHDWTWVPSALTSMDADNFANKLDSEVRMDFEKISFYQLVDYALGYETRRVSLLLKRACALRDTVAHHFQAVSHSRNSSRDMVVKASCPFPETLGNVNYRHPVTEWIIHTSQYIYEVRTDPAHALDLLVDPIRQLFLSQDRPVLETLRILTFMAAKYQFMFSDAINTNWHRDLSFSFFEQINDPLSLAQSITASLGQKFRLICVEDILKDGERLKAVGRDWDSLCYDVTACIVTDPTKLSQITELAESLIQQRNYSSATAVGGGIDKAGLTLFPLPIWALIAPENNFAGSRAYSKKRSGLPYLPPIIHKLRHSDNSGEQLVELFEFVRYLGGDQRQQCPLDTMKKQEDEGKERWQPAFSKETEPKDVGLSNCSSLNGSEQYYYSLGDVGCSERLNTDGWNVLPVATSSGSSRPVLSSQTISIEGGEDSESRDQNPAPAAGVSMAMPFAYPKRTWGQSRKHRVPPSQQKPSQKVRTMAGCKTCRRRKKKCDETKPSCQNCDRRNVFCVWDARTHWTVGKKQVKARSVRDTGPNIEELLDESTNLNQDKAPGKQQPRISHNHNPEAVSSLEVQMQPTIPADILEGSRSEAFEFCYRRADGRLAYKYVVFGEDAMQTEDCLDESDVATEVVSRNEMREFIERNFP